MASFTTQIKDEITKIESNKLESISELCAFLKYNDAMDNILTVKTENPSVARRIFNLLKRIYGVNINLTVRTQKKFFNKKIYYLNVVEKVNIIKNDIESVYRSINDLTDEEQASYLKGTFLAVGSINDPAKSKYHLEFLIGDEKNSKTIDKLLKHFRFSSKILKREKGYMVYLKQAEEISDFIKLIGAINALFYFEDIRIYRDHKNMVNRLNNCEQANVEKSMKTCNEQLENINYLKENDLESLLDDKTKLIISYRIKYPETTMSELAEIISLETDINITKSGINHHFRKIKELVEKNKNKDNV